MTFRWAAASLIGVTISGAVQATDSSPEPLERVWFAMGTRLEISISGMARDKAMSASEAAYQTVNAVENRLSTWKKDSELFRLNQIETGKSFTPTAALFHDLRDALSCAQKTGFAFSPWTGPLVQAWGLRTGGRLPNESEIQNALRASAQDAFEFKAGQVTKKASGAAFEEGGFGKGVGLDEAITSLKQNGVSHAVLNFGGQLSVLGDQPATVEISDPSDRSKTLLRFQMTEGSVATSSNSEHGLQVERKKIGHLLDASTGHPAPFEGSTTIVAPTGAAADCMTKVFVMGPEKSLKWAEKNSVQLLWIVPSLDKSHKTWIARPSCAWKFQLDAISPDVEIQKDRCT